jgi:hypothetical protein
MFCTPLDDFSISHENVAIVGEGLQNMGPILDAHGLWAGGIFLGPLFLRHKVSVSKKYAIQSSL